MLLQDYQRAHGGCYRLRPGQEEGRQGGQRSHLRPGRGHLRRVHPNHRGGNLRGIVDMKI